VPAVSDRASAGIEAARQHEELRNEARALVQDVLSEALAPLHYGMRDLVRRLDDLERRAVPSVPPPPPPAATAAPAPIAAPAPAGVGPTSGGMRAGSSGAIRAAASPSTGAMRASSPGAMRAAPTSASIPRADPFGAPTRNAA
jgi:hypothetical protein